MGNDKNTINSTINYKSKSELGSIYLNNVITILCKHIESLNNCKLINNDNEENTEEINSEKENK